MSYRKQNEHAPIRRNSKEAGRCEGEVYRPIRRADLNLMIRAAQKQELTARLSGKKNGPLGHIGIEVLRELASMIDHKTGRLDPSYNGLAARLRRSRSAVAAALKRLREHGWLAWLRRVDRNPAGQGPRWRQVTNAYAILMPPAIRRMLGCFAFAPLPPEDDEDRRRDQARLREAWDKEQRIIDLDPALADALARLGRAVNACESA